MRKEEFREKVRRPFKGGKWVYVPVKRGKVVKCYFPTSIESAVTHLGETKAFTYLINSFYKDVLATARRLGQ